MHQFLAPDDSVGPKSIDDDDQGVAMRALQALAKDDLCNSEATPSTGTLVLALASYAPRCKSPIDAVENFEYGDKALHAHDADSSDHLIHQFLLQDDSRVGLKSTDDDVQGFVMRTSQAIVQEDPLDRVETPSMDTFVPTASVKARSLPIDDDENGSDFEHGDKESHACGAERLGYSIHHCSAADAGRADPKSTEDEDLGFAQDDHLNSEAMPSTDSLVLIAELQAYRRMGPIDADVHGPEPECGNNEAGREGPKSLDDADQGFAMRRPQAFVKGDHFNSDETPSTNTLDHAIGPINSDSPHSDPTLAAPCHQARRDHLHVGLTEFYAISLPE